MQKSRVESAVQELPPRSGRSRSDISALRPLDRLLLGAEATPSKSGGGVAEEAFIDPTGIDEILFDDVVIDEAELHGVGREGYESPLSSEQLTSDQSAYDAPGFYESIPDDSSSALVEMGKAYADQPRASKFTEALIDELLVELRGSLSSALGDAERVLADPERVATWFENQARRRLLALTVKFSDELRATEVKRVLTSPPSGQ